MAKAQLLLAVLCIAALLAAVDASHRHQRHRSKRHHRAHSGPAWFPPGLPYAPLPMIMRQMSLPANVGLPNVLPGAAPVPFPRFQQAGLGATAQATTTATAAAKATTQTTAAASASAPAGKIDGTDFHDFFNLLASVKYDLAKSKEDLAKHRKEESDSSQQLALRARSLETTQVMVDRLEECMSRVDAKSGKDDLRQQEIVRAQEKAANIQRAKDNAKRQAELNQEAANNAREAQMLMDGFEKLKTQERAYMEQMKDLATKKLELEAKSKAAGTCNTTEVKVVHVPQVIYKDAPHGCAAITECGVCTADPKCGWCEATKMCLSATGNGTTDKCDADSWSYNFCKHHECKKHVNCRSCMADPRCGMCGETGQCMNGELSGPSHGTCSQWNYATDLRFLTYNVYGRDVQNLTGRAPWLFRMIQQSDADFIALQEVEDWFIELLVKEKWAMNYHMSDFGSGHAPGGLLIMSKVPLEAVSYFERTDPGQVDVDQRARFLSVKPKMGSRNLVIATSTLDWRSSSNRASSLDFIFSVLNASSDVVFMGDMNFDVRAQPESSRLPATYHDVWETVNGAQTGFTWDPEHNHYARASDPSSRPSRIDRMFVKSGFWSASKIDKIGCPEASPHYGLVAEFSMFGAYC